MTVRELRELYARMNRPVPEIFTEPSANKFNATKKSINGILFASSGEARCYQLLTLQERAGIISDLERQPEYLLQKPFTDSGGIKRRAITYTPDFRFLRGGRTVVVDYKGMTSLPVFAIKHKLFRAKYPSIVFEIWTKDTLSGLY
jgi:uncharacterized protein DUF1064